jgi:DNA-binding transcriptional MocR family regulator
MVETGFPMAYLPLTHEFLAEMLGVQRSTVSATLRGLQGSGLIEQRRGGIAVLDRFGLERAACECYRKIRFRFERLMPGTYAEPRRVGENQPAQPVHPAVSTPKLRR